MLAKSADLLVKAGISIVDATGVSVPVRASSWRAGGVQSAKEAGISDALIKSLGRWTSVAWFNYHFSSLRDFQVAARAMWRSPDPSRALVVGSFSPAGIFSDAI
jgi:hypothetical protein